MTQQTIYYGLPRPPHPGVNNSMLQDGPIVCDIYDAMANADTAVLTLPVIGDLSMAPRDVQVYRHTGGDVTSAASATFALNNGATLQFQIDPNSKADSTQRGQVQLNHTLVGLTNGSATAAQIAASINGDVNLQPYIRAVAGLTANAVTLFPMLSAPFLFKSTNIPAAQQFAALEGSQVPQFTITGGTAANLLAFPAGFVGYNTRSYVSQTIGLAGVTGFSYAYNATTRALTLTNTTGGAVNRVSMLVWM